METQAVTLRNWIGRVDLIARFVDRAHIMYGITTYPSDMIGAGHIRISGSRGLVGVFATD